MRDEVIDWMGRQPVPWEAQLDEEVYVDYAKKEWGISGGTEEVARVVWRQTYDVFPELGIRPFEIHRVIKGEPFVETRYAIKGYPGAWGIERTYDIAIEKAEYLRQWEWVRWLGERRRRE